MGTTTWMLGSIVGAAAMDIAAALAYRRFCPNGLAQCRMHCAESRNREGMKSGCTAARTILTMEARLREHSKSSKFNRRQMWLEYY